MQIGLDINPLGVMVGLVIVLTMTAAALTDVVLIIVVLVRRRAGSLVFAIGATTCFASAALLLQRLSGRVIAPSFLMAMYFSVSVLGLLLMLAALSVSFRISRAVFALLALPVLGIALEAWIDMERRDGLREAVLQEDVAAARAWLSKGAARHRHDGPFRQAMIVEAAHDANFDLVAALLSAGADPNTPDDQHTPLVAAITADPVLRLHEIDRQVHRRNRLRTAKLLLDHGADPNRPAKPGQPTPAELAWAADDREMQSLLEEKGANNARTVASDFENLMLAAAEGDSRRVDEIVNAYGGRLQQDPAGRAPLVAAAAGGHLTIVDSLLKRYHGLVSCELVYRALDAAAQGGHSDVFLHLLDVCVNFYDGRPLVSAAAAGRADLVRAALAKGYPVRATNPKTQMTAVEAAAAAGHEDVVKLLRAQ
ncbi:MAG TPA: ankyrin repeat domain-containing protein [Thermoanaerobaculia bacterium]|nr:ankyrin repeat domain-containing protein [Thermoanaerobaculia bacterium]